jgi:hypothetical protein
MNEILTGDASAPDLISSTMSTLLGRTNVKAAVGGTATNDVARDTAELLARWSALGSCPYTTLAARMRAAFATLLETLP